MSMITDVSMSPGVGRRSATTNRTLVEDAIDIPPELRRIDPGCCPERGNGCLRADELPPPQRRQLTNRCAVSRDDQAFAAVEGPHDLTALIPQLALRDFSRHSILVSLVLQSRVTWRGIRGGGQTSTCDAPACGQIAR